MNYLSYPQPNNNFDPGRNPIANQYNSGVPIDTTWDAAARTLNPFEALLPVLNTLDAYGNMAFTNTIDFMTYADVNNAFVYSYNINYQGEAPMDLQPTLAIPYPWQE